MKNFAYSVLLGAIGTIPAYAQDGSICVDAILVDLFEAINALRAEGSASPVGTTLATLAAGSSNTYTYANGNTTIEMLEGAAKADGA